MLAHGRNVSADGNVGNSRELHQIHDRHSVIGGTDVRIETQPGTKKRWAVFAGEDDYCCDQKNGSDEYDPESGGAVHQFTMRWRTSAIWVTSAVSSANSAGMMDWMPSE